MTDYKASDEDFQKSQCKAPVFESVPLTPRIPWNAVGPLIFTCI